MTKNNPLTQRTGAKEELMNKKTVTMLTLLSLTAGALLTGCSPTVKIEASDKPIVINMNIKIDHEIRIKVDRDLDSLLDNKKGLF